MPDTPLNPDALEAASRATDPESWGVLDAHRGDPVTERLRASLIAEAAQTVTAYLAVAQPKLQANSKPNQNLEFVNILEILEAHDYRITEEIVPGYGQIRTIVCNCGDRYGFSESHRAHLAEVLDKHMQEREAQLRQLVRDMTDPGECWFDHHGGCQEHGYLDLKPGELCPHAEAKQLLGDETNGR